MLAALDDTGFGRMVRNAVGYADFGYVPQGCASSTADARAINGESVRVCQYTGGHTRGWFAGHPWYPIGQSAVTIHVALPDAQHTYSFGAYGSDASGVWRSFSRPSFGLVVAGDPVMASERFAAWEGATRYLDVVRTTRIDAGSSSYTLTWSITNTSGTTQRIRPLVATSGYGLGTPQWTTAGSPRRITVRNPRTGGAVTLAESGVGGSPPVASFTSGVWSRTNAAITPAAGGLDNQLHDDAVDDASSATMSMAWPVRTLAPNATANFSATLTLAPTRELQLTLAGPEPSWWAPTQLEASIVEDRPVAGSSVRWFSVDERDGPTGSAVIGGDGHAMLSIPAKVGARAVQAYVDTNNNGLQDDDEAGTIGTVYAPASGTPPIPTPAPQAPAAPAVPPQTPTKAERVVVTLGYFLTKSRFKTFNVKDVPAGSTVKATCPKGCAHKTYTKRKARGTVSLKRLVGGRRMRAGTTITVTVSRPGAIAAVKIFTMRKGGKPPKITTRCQAPGAKKPTACK